MSNIFDFEILQKSRSHRYMQQFSGIIRDSRPTRRSIEQANINAAAHLLATCWELLFATFSAIICSAYALRLEEKATHQQVRASLPHLPIDMTAMFADTT